ncbi:MAG: hypothetical protein P8M25_04935 [Paracoccaceae bacterium]|nr:hypothetical protein [Paracoccaceae bacterium]
MILVSYNLKHDEICKLPGYESTLLAWPIIRNQFKDELSNSDKTAEETIHFLVYVLAGHPPLVIGALGVGSSNSPYLRYCTGFKNKSDVEA